MNENKSLEPGSKAPSFQLPDQDGKLHALKDYLGKKVILYFYPKDSTPGCTQESCDFRDQLKSFQKLETVVLGVSGDSVVSHKKFATAKELNFPILSDESHKMLQAYGVWQQKSLYGRKFMGIVRTTFLIDEKGKIHAKWDKVKVKGHTEEVRKEILAMDT